MHGVYVNATKIKRAELAPGAQIQLGNVTLKFSPLGSESATGAMAKLPWVEQQQLLLQLVQTLNATLVLSPVLEQVTDAIMHITGAERGFLLLADNSPAASRYPIVAGLRLRVVRGRADAKAQNGHGISGPIVRRALETGEVISTLRSARRGVSVPTPARPEEDTHPVQTIVCLPLRSPRARRRRCRRLPARDRGALRRQRRLGGALQRRRAARRGGARAPRRARDRERAAVRARAAHDRGAAEGAEAAAAVGEARHDRPDGGRHRPRAQHAAHLHHGQPGAARAAGADAGPARDAVLDRPRLGADPHARPAPARLQPPRARGDGPARRQRRRRAQPRAVPVPDRERARVAREGARRRTCRACWASRTSSRWRSSTWW